MIKNDSFSQCVTCDAAKLGSNPAVAEAYLKKFLLYLLLNLDQFALNVLYILDLLYAFNTLHTLAVLYNWTSVVVLYGY